MGELVDGKWVRRWYRPDDRGRFVRERTTFRRWITADGSSGFAPEAGRYHLYVSYACPWAHRTLIVRRLKGLEDTVSVSVVHPFMGEDGWEFAAYPGSTPDPVRNAKFLRDVYVAADPQYTGRATVPVLWDRKTGTIVNNESREIMRMLDHGFAPLTREAHDYAPAELRAEADGVIDAIYGPINDGVYRCGFAASQDAYDEAVAALFGALDHWERALGRRRYLCGARLTEADWCMFTTLYRFDAVYHVHFKCNLRRIVDYPNLWNYVKELYQYPGVRDTCNMDHIKSHYYRSHESINPRRIVPAGPRLDFDEPHDRGRLAGPRFS